MSEIEPLLTQNDADNGSSDDFTSPNELFEVSKNKTSSKEILPEDKSTVELELLSSHENELTNYTGYLVRA